MPILQRMLSNEETHIVSDNESDKKKSSSLDVRINRRGSCLTRPTINLILPMLMLLSSKLEVLFM